MNRFIGITGNIGCGKSTVTTFFSAQPGVLCIQCDSMAKQIMLENRNRKTVAQILRIPEDSTNIAILNRAKAVLFSEPETREAIQNFIHPIVWENAQKTAESADSETLIFLESAIIFEIGWKERFAKIITVVCEEHIQRERLRIKGWGTEEIEKRINIQLPQREKAAQSDFVIRNSSTMGEMRRQAQTVLSELQKLRLKNGL